MTQMAVASRAAYFGTAHAMAFVMMFGNMIRRDGLSETGPARSRIELVDAVEHRIGATGAAIDAIGLVMIVSPGKGCFGSRFTQYVKLIGGKLLTPFGFGQVDMLHVPDV